VDKDLESLISECGLEEFSDRIKSSARSSVRFKTKPKADADIPSGASKLGGKPDLPRNVECPTDSGMPYVFLCQICMEDLGSFEISKNLPKQGRLYFFIAADSMEGGAIVHDESSPDELERRDFPEIDEEILEFEEKPQTTEFNAASIYSFYSHVSLPHPKEIHSYFEFSEDERKQYELLFEAVEGEESMHQLLGYNYPLQAGMIPEHHLLLQVDEEQTAGLSWVDGGLVYFTLPELDFSCQGLAKAYVFVEFL